MKLNSKFKIKNSKLQQGFTLIELLAVMSILAVVGVLVSVILVSSLRVSTKTTTLSSVKQNGFYAIASVSKMLREANSLLGVSTDGTNFSDSCVIPTVGATTPTPTPIRYAAIKIVAFDAGENILSCTSDNIASNSGLLLDTNAVSMVANTCYFSCEQTGVGDSPTIGINFSLKQKSSSSFVEFTASASAIQFQTSVTLRN